MTQMTSKKLPSAQSLFIFGKHQPHWAACVILIILVSIYWGFVASNRYVSHAHVVISIPQISTTQGNFSSSDTSNASQQLAAEMLLRDYIRSADMVNYLVKNTDFRQHFSQNGDVFSRLWRENAPMEKLLSYYQGMVSVEPDEYSGVLHVDVQAFSPEEAHEFATLILAQGQRHMNEMSQNVAEAQVKFLKKQSEILQKEYQNAQQASLAFQNQHHLPEPSQTLQNFGSIVGQLQSQLASLRAKKSALASYQSSRSAEMVSINSQIQAVQRQIQSEQQKMASSSGNPLNAIAARYQALQLRSQFALQAYSGVLTALENARVSAVSQTVQVSYLQSPTLPQYSEKPTRLYNISVFALIAIFITLIINMLILIVKDHKD